MEPLRLSLADAWERFDSFHDSLIHSVELDLRPDRDHRADIEIDGWERDEVTSTWSGNAVHFHFDGVKEYRFWEKNWAIEVVKGAA
jgi:hypothetical protein